LGQKIANFYQPYIWWPTFFFATGLTTEDRSYNLVSRHWAVAIWSPIDLRWQTAIVLGEKSGE